MHITSANIMKIYFVLALILSAGLSVTHEATAQAFPSKPIRFLVGAPPGGGADFVARGLAPKLSESLGQPVVVENRAGANGVVASELLAHAAPDGYTIKVNTTGDIINPSLMKLGFNVLQDFAFISLVAESQNLLVAHPSFPATSITALIALSKAKPTAITFGSQGIGSSGHLAGELFQLMAQVKWVHVPYKGGSLALIDLVGGQISISFGKYPYRDRTSARQKTARHCRHWRAAHLCGPRHPDSRRKRITGLRSQQLVRRLGPRRHTARSHRPSAH